MIAPTKKKKKIIIIIMFRGIGETQRDQHGFAGTGRAGSPGNGQLRHKNRYRQDVSRIEQID